MMVLPNTCQRQPSLLESLLLICGDIYVREYNSCGEKLMVERNAYFGNSKQISVGKEVGFGDGLKIMTRIISIVGDNPAQIIKYRI